MFQVLFKVYQEGVSVFNVKDNFKKYEKGCSADIIAAAPHWELVARLQALARQMICRVGG